MRVVQVGPFPPPHGGVETNLVAIRDYLREQGHSCAVINITRHRKQEVDEVYYPNNAAGLLWDLFRTRYDIVHLHVGGKIPPRVLALALACTTVPRAKAILTLHSGGFPSFPEAQALNKNSVFARILRRFNGIIGVNPEMIKFFLRLGVPEKRTRLIYPHSVSRSTVADRLTEPLSSFFSEQQRVLIAVCGLEPEYDLPRQIEALGPVLERYPRIGLAIVGSGSQEAELRRLIEVSPYSQHILLTGDVPHAVTLRAIAESAALLRTTLYDGDAISVREALFLGTPVIATDNGMRPGGVELIPIADTPALISAIEHVLTTEAPAKPQAHGDESNLAEVLNLYSSVFRKAS